MVDKIKTCGNIGGAIRGKNGISILAFIFGSVHIPSVFRGAEKNWFGKSEIKRLRFYKTCG